VSGKFPGGVAAFSPRLLSSNPSGCLTFYGYSVLYTDTISPKKALTTDGGGGYVVSDFVILSFGESAQTVGDWGQFMH